MKAYEFLAYDRAGCTLIGTTDGSYCLWDGTEDQKNEAEMQRFHFEEYGFFYDVDRQDDYERDARMGL